MTYDQNPFARIDSLYGNARAMIWLCVVGIVIPFVLLIGAALGIVYWFFRRSLLAQLDAARTSDGPPPPPPSSRGGTSLEQKIAYIREAKYAFLAPAVVLVCYALVVGTFVAVVIASSPR